MYLKKDIFSNANRMIKISNVCNCVIKIGQNIMVTQNEFYDFQEKKYSKSLLRILIFIFLSIFIVIQKQKQDPDPQPWYQLSPLAAYTMVVINIKPLSNCGSNHYQNHPPWHSDVYITCRDGPDIKLPDIQPLYTAGYPINHKLIL